MIWVFFCFYIVIVCCIGGFHIVVTKCYGIDLLICLCIQKRFDGTRVTIETFMAWKAKFDSELAQLKQQKGKDDVTNKKLTGTNYNYNLLLPQYLQLQSNKTLVRACDRVT